MYLLEYSNNSSSKKLTPESPKENQKSLNNIWSMNKYIVTLEMDEFTYRKLKKLEVKLKWKDRNKCTFIPFSKRQIKYEVGHYFRRTN